ncbi:MAG: methyltransferase domain-containing protein [Acidobacteriota bacterium]
MNRTSYDAIVTDWERARVALSDAERRILALLCEGLGPGSTILDLGCGTGRPVAEHLVARGFRLTGVDQSPKMLDVAQRLLPEQEWILGSLETFTPHRTYDAAVAWDSLFHIPRAEHEGILRRVRAALPVGGRLALTVGGSDHSAFTDTMFGHEFFYDSHPPKVVEALLESLGFELVHCEFLDLPTSERDKGRYALVAAHDSRPTNPG